MNWGFRGVTAVHGVLDTYLVGLAALLSPPNSNKRHMYVPLERGTMFPRV